MKQRFEHECDHAAGTEIDEVLKKYEVDGWELVTAYTQSSGYTRMFFKRPFVADPLREESRCPMCHGSGTVNFEQAAGWDEPCPKCAPTPKP